MTLVVKDRVREQTTTTGTGTITLNGAVTGFQSFSAIGNANTTYYAIVGVGTSEWEVGLGTYTSSGTTLSRDTILASSNSGSAVNFSAGTKDVFCVSPAVKSPIYDAAGNFNATTATTLQTARLINGVSFNGSADITVTAAAGTLTGTTLASGVVASSLTSVGTLTSLTVSGNITLQGGELDVSAVASDIKVIAATASAFIIKTATLNYYTLDTTVSTSNQNLFIQQWNVADVTNTGTNTLRSTTAHRFLTPTVSLSGAANATGTSSQAAAIGLYVDPPIAKVTNASAQTLAEVSTVVIGGAGFASQAVTTISSAIGLHIASNNVIIGGATVTNAYGVYIEAPSGAGTNYAGRFDGDVWVSAGAAVILDNGAPLQIKRNTSNTPISVISIGSGNDFVSFRSGQGSSGSLISYQWVDNASNVLMELYGASKARLILFGAANTNSTDGCVVIANGTAPTANPTSAYFIYVTSGALKGRGSSGTVTTIGAADPHCPVCGRDFMTEHENESYGSYLSICLFCLADELGERPYILRTKPTISYDGIPVSISPIEQAAKQAANLI